MRAICAESAKRHAPYACAVGWPLLLLSIIHLQRQIAGYPATPLPASWLPAPAVHYSGPRSESSLVDPRLCSQYWSMVVLGREPSSVCSTTTTFGLSCSTGRAIDYTAYCLVDLRVSRFSRFGCVRRIFGVLHRFHTFVCLRFRKVLMYV